MPIPSDSSKQRNEITKIAIWRSLTLLSTFVYLILLLSCLMFILQFLLVKDLCWLRVSIIDADNTVAPSVAQDAVSLSQEFFLILKFAKLSQLLFHLCNFIACCKGRSQGNTTLLCFNAIHPRGVVVEEGRAKIFQSFNTLLSDAQMLIPFFFIQQRCLAFLL